MKKEPNLLLISSFLLFFLLHTTLTASVDSYYQTCQPYTCGNLNITYPFYILGYQQSYYGEPGFDIHCLSNKYPTINLSNHLYNITSISYSEKYIQISDSAFNRSSSFDSTHGDVLLTCPNCIHSLTFEGKFTYSSYTQSMILLFNCSQTVLKTLPTRSKINCSNNKTIVALYGEDSGQFDEVKKECGETESVPYMGEDQQEDAEQVLENGFRLSYSLRARTVEEDVGRLMIHQSLNAFARIDLTASRATIGVQIQEFWRMIRSPSSHPMIKDFINVLDKFLIHGWWGSISFHVNFVEILNKWLQVTHMESRVSLQSFREIQPVGGVSHPVDHLEWSIETLDQTLMLGTLDLLQDLGRQLQHHFITNFELEGLLLFVREPFHLVPSQLQALFGCFQHCLMVMYEPISHRELTRGRLLRNLCRSQGLSTHDQLEGTSLRR